MSDGEIERSEVEAGLAARQELGPQYDAAMVESFADRIEQAVQARLAAEVAQRSGSAKADAGHAGRQFVLGIASLGCGIPITAISAGTEGTSGLIVAWLGIAAVNAAHALAGRGR